MPQSEPYNSEFYTKFVRGSLRSARAILPEVFKIVTPRSVADIGCGLGTWLGVAKEFGVARVLGVDGSHVNRAALLIDPDEFVACELACERLPAVLSLECGQFDLTLCLEVAEHLPAQYAGSLVEALTSTSDVVLFSAAIPFQGGINHLNEQWPEYWALLFESHRFICYDCLRDRFWLDPTVEWWYSQNTLLFVHEGWDAPSGLLPPSEGRRPLSRVHPLNYLCRAIGEPYADMQRFRELSNQWAALG